MSAIFERLVVRPMVAIESGHHLSNSKKRPGLFFSNFEKAPATTIFKRLSMSLRTHPYPDLTMLECTRLTMFHPVFEVTAGLTS